MRNVLVVCDNNAALSVIVEALINARGNGAWRAFSAGASPSTHINRHALQALRSAGVPLDLEAKPKSWTHFATTAAPRLDVVITLSEALPFDQMPDWPGAPRQLHWALPDPLAVPASPSERAAMFEAVAGIASAKVDAFLEDERRVRMMPDRANDNADAFWLSRKGA